MSRVFPCGVSAAFILALTLVLQPAAAQKPADLFTKAPPDIDQALRERITKFFQLQVEGKSRQGEAFVAEDSKDFYYEMQKPRYLSFEIRNITYADEFTKAQAVIAAEMYVAMPGMANKPLKVPFMTRWKVIDGQWYWYVEPESGTVTPFGKMNPSKLEGGAASPLPDMSKTPDIAALWKQVHVDKQSVRLKAGEASSDQVTISSQVPGNLVLEVHPLDVPGLKFAVDRTQLKPGEKAVLSYHFEPSGKAPRAPITMLVTVQPINYNIPIRITFQ